MENRTGTRFSPVLAGCVATDARAARALEGCYLDALYTVAAESYRAARCEEWDGEQGALFRELAEEALYCLRILGELIVALGGDPAPRAQLRVDSYAPRGGCPEAELRECDRMLRDAIRERKRRIECMESVMGKTQDGVVRSVLATLIGEERRHAERLRARLK